MKTQFIMALAMMVVLAPNLLAEQIVIIDYNAVITEGDTYETVVIKGDDTVVDMTGGTVDRIITMNGSTLNISGGESPSGYPIDVRTHDTSTVNVSGGNVYFTGAGGSSTVNISGGDVGYLESVTGSSHVNILGEVTISFVEAYHSAVISVSAGTVGDVHAHGACRLIITGGTVAQAVMDGPARLDISGGTLNGIGFDELRYEPVLNVIGNNLSKLPYSHTTSGEGMISGRWNDDTPFTIAVEPRLYDAVTLWDGVVPAECVNEPASDASGDCKVDLTDLAIMSTEWLQDGTQ